MSWTISIRLATATRSQHGGQRRHDLRQRPVPAYVATERSRDNSSVVRPPTVDAMTAAANQRRTDRYERGDYKRRPAGLRRDAIIALEGIITFGTEAQSAIEALPRDEQDRRYLEAAEAIASHVGTDLAGLVVHRDETAPHAHFSLYGYDPYGQPVSERLNKGKLSQLQDEAATVYADLGIERGKRIGERLDDGESPATVNHRSVRELHCDLPAELDAAREKLDRANDKLQKAQQRAETAHRKANDAEAGGASRAETLRQRALRYEQRAEKAAQAAKQAEHELTSRQQRLDQLATKVPVPEPDGRLYRRETHEKEQRRGFKKVIEKVNRYKPVKAHKPETVRGSVSNANARADLERSRRIELEQQIARAMAARSAAWLTAEYDLQQLAIHAIQAEAAYIERYSVILQRTERMTQAPPQGASAAQVAAALYRDSQERGWASTTFWGSDAEAEKIMAMADEDGRLERIQFTDAAQQERLDALIEQRAAALAAEQAREEAENRALDRAFDDDQPRRRGPDMSP